MKFRATPLLAILLATVFVGSAQATVWPPGSGGGCPTDTLTIPQLQIPGACRPAHLDTVKSIKGIVTAIKSSGTSRSFYMQARRSNQLTVGQTGMNCFYGSPNFTDLQIGDSVAVYGHVDTTFGVKAGYAESFETEITRNASDPTLVYYNLGHLGASAVPPMKTLTVQDIKFPAITWQNFPGAVVNPSATTGEPWENMVVRIKGPLTVAKTDFPTYVTHTPGIERRTNPSNGGGMLAYLNSSVGDSIEIDETSFVILEPPAVGTVIDSVYGVLQNRTTDGLNYYRVAIRSTDDIFLATPPGLASAFMVGSDSVMVVFDRDVTQASATQLANYSFPNSGATANNVHMVADNSVVLHISSTTLSVGDLETVRVNGVTGLVNNKTMTSPKDKSFTWGIVPIPDVQAPNPDSLAAGSDYSQYAGPGFAVGPVLTIRGVATNFELGREYYVQEKAGGPRSGVQVFAPTSPLIMGHQYLIAAQVIEYFGETQVQGTLFIRDEGVKGYPPIHNDNYAVLRDFTADMSQSVNNGEDWEGCLVHFNQKVEDQADVLVGGAGGFWHAHQQGGLPADSIEVEGYNITHDYNPGDVHTATGVLSYRFGLATLIPRFDSDYALADPASVGGGTIDKVSFAIHPNPARTAEVNFALPRRDNVDLAVFDLGGRRVHTLAKGSFAPGSYNMKWDGSTDSGHPAGPGMYFYRLKVGDQTFNIRGVHLQ